ncbi:MAG: peptidyl-prolyl cis-trans isomerase [Nitrospirae bacterium]|nr:peptidyl-prolyl cis-trans isomerase [Nitrospirota bacterium]
MIKAVCIMLSLIGICLSCPAMAGESGGGPSQEQAGQGVAEGPGQDAGKTVAARVNGRDITLKAVLEMMDRVRASKGPDVVESAEAVRKEALDRVVTEELAYQSARAGGMKIDPSEVDKRVERLKERMGGDFIFRKLLEKEATTEEDFRAETERGIILNRVFMKEVVDKVVVSEDEIRSVYEKEKFLRQEKITVTDVVFFLEPEDAGSVAKAGEILKKLLEEGDRDPFKIATDGTFIAHDAELRKDRDAELCEEARKMKPGDISGVIKTGDSLHIIKLKEYTPEKQFAFEEVRGVILNKLRTEARKKRLREWEDALRKDAKIEIIEAEKIK